MKKIALNLPLPVSLLNILPATLSLIFAGIFIALSGRFLWSVALFLGIIAGSLVDIDHRLRGRMRFMLWVIPAFVLVSLTIESIRQIPALLTLFMTLLAFSMTYLGALDNRYRTIAFGTLVAALYTLLIYQPQLPFYVNPTLILCGTLLYQIVALIVQILMPNRPVQMSLALSYRALSDFIEAKADFFDPDEIQSIEVMQSRLADNNFLVIQAFNQCREALFRRLEGEHISARTRRQLRDYVIAQDIHERLSSSHIDYEEFAEQWQHSDVIFRIQRMIRIQARTCNRMAQALEQSEPLQATGKLTRAMAGLKESIDNHVDLYGVNIALTRLIANLDQVNAQIRTLTQPHEVDFDRSISSAQVKGFKRAKQLLVANFTPKSRYFRHALRMGLLTLLISSVVELTNLTFGYWILLTTIFVIQPNFSATKARLGQRIIGTLMGVLIGSFIALIQPDVMMQITLMVLANICFFYFRHKNYSLSTMFLTIQVLMGFSLLGIHVEATIWPRVIYTCIGSALAWGAVVYLWPDWRYFNLGEAVDNALGSAAEYLTAIMNEFSLPSTQDVHYRSARRRAHEYATELAQLVHEIALFPERFRAEIPLANRLLNQHFRLLSDLSALGAARETANALDDAVLQIYLKHGRELSHIIASLDSTYGCEPILMKQEDLNILPAQDHLLTQQFNRIEKRVAELSVLLNKLNSDECQHYQSITNHIA